LFVAWNIFAYVNIVTARYMRDKWQTNMILHMAFGTAILFSTMYWCFWCNRMNGGFFTTMGAAEDMYWLNKLQKESPETAIISRYTNGVIGEVHQFNDAEAPRWLHTFSGMIVSFMALPLVVTGLFAYFRRW
jgi:hypothetical protein